MNADGGALHFDSDIDNRKYFAKILAMEKRTDLFAVNVIKANQRIDDSFNQLANNLANGAFKNGLNSVETRVSNLQETIIRGNTNAQASYDRLGASLSGGRFRSSLQRAQTDFAGLGRTAVNGNRDAANSFAELANSASRSGAEMTSVFTGLTGVIAGFLSIQAAQNFVNKVIDIRTEFENLDVAFTTILKSKEQADKLMNDVINFAATTPFGLTEVAKSTKQLLAYGVAAEDVKDELNTLGNIAAGVSQPIGEVAYLYGTLKTQGRAFAMDIRQFTGRGIPVVQELANVMGVAKDQVMSLVEEGKVGFPEVQKAFQNMTGAGGAFFNLMQKQSLTTGGRISNLKDQIDLMFNSFGEANSGIINGAITGLQYLVAHYDGVITMLGTMIATYGAYRAALVLTAAVEANMWGTRMVHNGSSMVAVTYQLTAAQTLQAIGAGIAAKAQAALNFVMNINPYVALTTAVIGLASAMYLLNDSTTVQEKAQKLLNEESKEYQKHTDDLKIKVRDLNSTLSDKTATDLQQAKAYEELQKIYPGLLGNMSKENYLKLESAEAQRLINQENDKANLNNLSTRYENAKDRVAELNKELKQLNSLSNVGGQGTTFQAAELRKEIEAAELAAQGLANSLKKENEELAYSKLSNKEKLEFLKSQQTELIKQRDSFVELNKLSGNLNTIFNSYNLGNLTNQIDAVTVKMQGLQAVITGKPTVRTLRDIDKDIEDIKDKQKGSSSAAQFKDFQAQIDKFEAEKQKITGKVKTADKKAINERQRFLDNLIDLENKSLAKTLTDNEEAIKAIYNKYEEQRNKARKLGLGAGVITRINRMEQRETGILKYDQDTEALLKEIGKQKDIYEKYEEYKTTISKQAADERYKNELKDFSSFTDYLQANIQPLQDLALWGDLTGQEQERLTKLLELQKQHNTDLNNIDAKRFADAYNASATFNQKVLQIEAKYQQDLKALGENADKEQQQNLLRARNSAIDSAQEEANKKTAIYQKLNADVLHLTKKQAETEVETIETILKTAKGLTPEIKEALAEQLKYAREVLKVGSDPAYINALKEQKKAIKERLATEKLSSAEIKEYKKTLSEITTELNEMGSLGDKIGDIGGKMADIGGAFSELGSSLEELNPELAYTLGSLGDLLQVGSDAAKAFASFSSGDIVGGIVGTVKVVSGLFSMSSKVRKMNEAAKKEVADFYKNAQLGEIEYQALLRERERQTKQLNAIGLKGIEDQTEALKKQQSQINSDFNKTLSQLQNQTQGQITGQTYKHGTWLRKAKVTPIYGSLEGMNYDQLEQLYTQDKLTEGAKALFEELKKLKEEGVNVEEALKDAAKAADELATGTTVESLSSNIIASLRAGKNGLKDVMDDYTAIIEDALLSTFKSEVVDVEMKAFYDRLAALSKSGGELTEEEIKQAQDDYIETRKRIEQQLKDREKITGVVIGEKATESGITASIKSISEDTAIVIEGILRGLYDAVKRGGTFDDQNLITLARQTELMAQSLAIQAEIRDNTGVIAVNTAGQLIKMDTMIQNLGSIITNTTQPNKSARDSGKGEL